MKNLLDDRDRKVLVERLEALPVDAHRRWGTMSVEAMLCHTADQLRFAVGDRVAKSPYGPLRTWILKWPAITLMPWPRGRVKAARSLLATSTAGFEDDRRQLLTLIERFGRNRGAFGPHPMFGPMSPKLWARLAWRHLDYHLRQFGA